MGENQQVSRVVGYKGGEIVEVEGGHIVRSIGRKDRHSKVCTAKGPRDRRVRLSANTAIQFYDVQDRLGYDRPSKAVDWLIKKAKAAIDELAELPAWQPIIQSEPEQEQENPNQNTNPNQDQHVIEEQMLSSSSCFGFQNQNPHLTSSSNFIAPSIDSDSIAETFKSPFSASTIQFQNYPPGLLSRTNSQELRLSLQSWNDSILLHNSDTTSLNQNHHHPHRFSSTTLPLGTEHALFSLSAAAGAASVAGGGGGGFWAWNNANPSAYNPPTPPPSSQLAQNQFFTQRGPLQSSNSPSIRADQHGFTSLISAGFYSGGFSGYQIPARIQGEEEQDGAVNKPCSVSSASRH